MGRVIPLRRKFSVASAVLVVFIIAGCAPDNGPGSSSPGIPDGLEIDPLSDGPTGTWIERDETFAIVTMGSSSCPLVVADIRAEGYDHIVVTFGKSPNNPCTADMAPTTHQFDLPAGITGRPVSVDIEYEDWPETHAFTLD